MPLEISVIVPSYNRAGFLPATLSSIVSQSHKPAEIIVVDDGSTDDTETVVRKFGSGVKYVRIENSGAPRARNVGVAATVSPWIAFCDSDDLWQSDKLSRQVRLFEQSPDVEYSFTNFRIVTDNQWSETSKFDLSPQGFWDFPRRQIDSDLFVIESPIFERLLWHQPIFPSTIMMTRRFFESVGRWDERMGRLAAEDFEFSLRCVDRPGIGVVSAPVVGIRKHDSNHSGDPLKTVIGEIAVLRHVLEHYATANEYAHSIEEQIIKRSAAAAEGAFEINDLQKMRQLLKAVPYLRRSLKLHTKCLIALCPCGSGQILRRVMTGAVTRSR